MASVVGSERWTDVDLAVGAEDLAELLPGMGGARLAAVVSGRLPGRRRRARSARGRPACSGRARVPFRCRRGTCGAPSAPCRCRPARARSAARRPHRQATFEDDVALVLRVGVARRRGVPRKEELDQRVALVNRLARHADRRQRSDEPQPLSLAGGRPRRRADRRTSHMPTLSPLNQSPSAAQPPAGSARPFVSAARPSAASKATNSMRLPASSMRSRTSPRRGSGPGVSDGSTGRGGGRGVHGSHDGAVGGGIIPSGRAYSHVAGTASATVVTTSGGRPSRSALASCVRRPR